MKTAFRKSLVAISTLAAIGTPMLASAESTFATVGNASARVDFTITIPRFVSLQVGATGAGISSITFAPTPAQIDAGGSIAGASVIAKVRGNNGTVTLTSNSTGALTSGTDTIPFTDITTATAVLTSLTALPAPVLSNGTSTAAALVLTGKVTNQDATWTYSYANTSLYPAGTYGATIANNGRVTYTASMP